MPGVKNQTVKQTYDDFICYAGTALAELVSSVPQRNQNDSDYSVFIFSELSAMNASVNASRLEQCDICCDVSQQVHNTNLFHIKSI